mmetsp:Transcript_27198/g.71660  ORF Transcript_27198/g.71660 Transcript_27198/m.71660 type:complete len:308 (+) Transcript_27198:242-1165(+)
MRDGSSSSLSDVRWIRFVRGLTVRKAMYQYPSMPAGREQNVPSGRRLLKRESSLEACRPSSRASRSFIEYRPDPATFTILCIVVLVICSMFLVIRSLPSISTVEKENEKFVWRPTTAAHFNRDKQLLLKYREAHTWRLFLGMSLLYIMLQTFCIPGSGTTLNVLAGCVFHDLIPHGEFFIALPYAVMCTTIGAVGCYMISFSTAREFVRRRFPGRVSWLQQKISEQNSSFFFLLSLRVSPLVPAWLLNIAAPLMPFSIWQFVFVTFIGSIPTNALGVQTGALLSKMQSGDNVLKANLHQVQIYSFHS